MPQIPPYEHTAQKNTTGGFQSACIFSGALAPGLAGAPGAVAGGADVLLLSGAGRLDTLMAHYPQQSGLQVIFYDSCVPTSGGPFANSGHKVVGILPPTWRVPSGVTVASGQTNFVDSTPGVVLQIGQCFQSGLCVALKSGQPGFTVNFTPEKAGQ